MSLNELKDAIHHSVDAIDDVELLQQILGWLAQEAEGRIDWDALPDQAKLDIQRGIAQLDRGEGIPDENIRQTYQRWLSK